MSRAHKPPLAWKKPRPGKCLLDKCQKPLLAPQSPPPAPHFWPKGIFQEKGVGGYILRAHAAGIILRPPPSLYSGVEKLTRSSLKGISSMPRKRQIRLSKVPLRNPIDTGQGQFLHSLFMRPPPPLKGAFRGGVYQHEASRSTSLYVH